MKKNLIWLLIVVIIIIGGVIMAHEKVYAVCENMCMEETMTKEQINNGLDGKSDTSHNHDDRYYTETEINTKITNINQKLNALTKTIEISVSAIGNNTISYPEGFTQSNTAVLSIMYSPSGNNYRTYIGGVDSSGTSIQVALSASNIMVTNNIISSGKIKIVLMATNIVFN